MKKYTLVLLIGALFLHTAHAQSKWNFLNPVPDGSRKYTVAINPFPATLNGGFGVSFEKRINNLPQWLQISPSVYYLPGDDDWDYWTLATDGTSKEVDDLKGAGIDIGYKLFLNKAEVFYCKGGISYNYYNIDYSSEELVNNREDGLNYYSYETLFINQHFNNVGANICFGVRSTVRRKPVFVDGYVGLAYQYSFYNHSEHKFNDNMYSYGYRGFLVTFGFRFGVAFGRTKAVAAE